MQQIYESCNNVDKILKERGYLASTIDKYWRYWNKLMSYMSEYCINDYSPTVGLNFLLDIYSISTSSELDKEKKWIVRSVQHLNDYREFGTIFPELPYVSTADCLKRFGGIIGEFKAYQRKKNNICETTLTSYDKYIGKFLLYIENQNINELSEITAAQIHDYCKIIAKHSDSIAHNMSCSLRVFLRYLHKEGILQDDFSIKIPSYTYSRKSKLPSSLNNEEKNALLNSVSRTNCVGKRDYAIILLACRLGLRSSDIRALRFSDFHWERNTLEIVTQKTGKTLILPLLDDVGQAIIEYIKYARPVTESTVVFQTCNAPIGKLSAPAVSNIVKKYARKAAINSSPSRRLGPHLLRNTLASALLNENVPLPEISSILSHSTTRTTQEYYLRIDINQLIRCALNPPPFSWEPTEEVF